MLTSFENRRTLEGFDASLTAKKAALLFLFTFAPVLYVGLAGESLKMLHHTRKRAFRMHWLQVASAHG